MKYDNYKASRDVGWELLLKYKIDKLPVKISDICRGEKIHIYSYDKSYDLIRAMGLEHDMTNNDGFSTIFRGEKYIFYDNNCIIGRQRFTVGHELGHFIMNHVQEGTATYRNKEPNRYDSLLEQEANIIASRILAPACVLWGIGIKTPEQIQEICGISKQAAIWRMHRLEKLYAREQVFLATYGYSCFLQSKLEKQVYKQFKDFIKFYKEKL